MSPRTKDGQAVLLPVDGTPTAEWEPSEEGLPSILWSPGTLVADRYRVERVLGAGGSGIVYCVFDRELEQEVAFKLLRQGASDQQHRRFRREVSLARELVHPGIVRVYDFGRSNGHDYFTMELVRGDSLASRLREAGPLSVDRAERYMHAIVDALAYLHARGIVHRDIKPGNILIEQSSDRVFLADFGLARPQNALDATVTGATVEAAGTPWYMAPEQMLGQAPDTRSDIYAFGATFYEVFTGHKPHDGATATAVAMRKHSDVPRPLRELRDEVPETLARVIERCLQRDPDDRFSSMAEVTDALADVTELPGVRVYRSWRPRWLHWIALGVMLVAVAVAGVSWLETPVLETPVVHGPFAPAAVTVTIDEQRFTGIDDTGREVWSMAIEPGLIGDTRQVSPAAGPPYFMLMERKRTRTRGDGWPIRQRWVLATGEVWLDSRRIEDSLYPELDFTTERGGVLQVTPYHWHRRIHQQTTMPVSIEHLPGYKSVLGALTDSGSFRPWLYNPGRIYDLAMSRDGQRMGVLLGNHVLLETLAFAIVELPDHNGYAHAPPSMGSRSEMLDTSLLSYTLLPNDWRKTNLSVKPSEHEAWQICGLDDDTCFDIDAHGNTREMLEPYAGVDSQAVLDRRMAFFRGLSRLYQAFETGALAAAEEEYLRLAEHPPEAPQEAAALHWIGARLAARRVDMESVTARSRLCQEIRPTHAAPLLLRGKMHALTGQYREADRDMVQAMGLDSADSDTYQRYGFYLAWLKNDHASAAESVRQMGHFYYKQMFTAALELAEYGHPERALDAVEPLLDDPIRVGSHLLRALALTELGRLDDARAAVDTECERNTVMEQGCRWVEFVIDIADGVAGDIAGDPTWPDPDVAMELLVRAEARGHYEFEPHLLLPRLRFAVAESLIHADRRAEGVAMLRAIADSYAGAVIKSRARARLRALGEE